MKTRVSGQKSHRSVFSKFLGCFFSQYDSHADDDEFLCFDEDDQYSESEKIESEDLQDLYLSIQRDVCYIHQHLNDAFCDRSKLQYPAYHLWLNYLKKHSFVFRDFNPPDFQKISLATIPELDLIQLIEREKYFFKEFSDKTNMHLQRIVNIVDVFPEYQYHFFDSFLQEKSKCIHIENSTCIFIEKLEKTVEIVQICNENIRKLNSLAKHENAIESDLSKLTRSYSSRL